jgi:hypothetical protein
MGEQETKKVVKKVAKKTVAKKDKLDDRAATMKEIIKKDDRVKIKIVSIDKKVTNIVEIDGVEYKSFGEPEVYVINGYKYYVPRGVMVPVPATIAQIIEDNDQTAVEGAEEINEKLSKNKTVN